MPPKPGYTLAFDCSAAHCAAALVEGGEIRAQHVLPMQKGQVEALMPLLQRLLEDAHVDWPNLARLVVGVGPGNFTGLRIGVSAARALSLASGVPAVGVSNLAARAYDQPGAVTALAPAPLEQVYAQRFTDGVPQEAPVLLARTALGAGPFVADPDLTAKLGLPGAGVPFAPARFAHAADHLPARALVIPPAPLYVKPAGAKPAADPPPVILDA